ncbi:MAG: DUF47 family protein [Alphaproteobacteria bacterium]|nr:DUF47 family protein [Alphaproteobacteria bacterium]MBL6938984.1 DUF47 family protein [Alphaproteobacteria bacterium]MBL7099576.1 DUF47 family protein [Alphaproteobacteria bacterium]
MTLEKTKIIGELGDESLLLPKRIAGALAANARIKFALSWLQAAEQKGLGGTALATDCLDAERGLAGLGDDPLYAAPEVLRACDGTEVVHSGAIVERLKQDVSEMCDAIAASASAGAIASPTAEAFRHREEALLAAVHVADDRIPPGFVRQLSRPPADGHDTVHGLVMDMHKAINTIAASVSEENLAGAQVHHLGNNGDRERVLSFMRGLNRTAPLKFDHPGLSTNAMRAGARLVIQNDIGTTDAHVLLVYVEGMRLSVTYSDIHLARLEFFCRRLKELAWTVSNRRAPNFEEEMFYVATGQMEAKDAPALDRALERLGAALVFLIDWNKARKSLRRLVPKADAIAILDWAAEHEVGHRGYLEAGGDALILDLLETVSKATGGFHASLQSAVGRDGAVEFLREALRIASDDLRNGRSTVAVRDRLRAELLARVASITDRIIEVALDHAALTLDLANLTRRSLLAGRPAGKDIVARAKAWELEADRQVTHIRELCGDGKERAWRQIASLADDAADNFEDTVFRLQFLSASLAKDVQSELMRLSEHSVAAVKEYVRLLSAMRNVHRGASRQDMRNFLERIEKLHDEEHATDEAERAVFSGLMGARVDAKALNLVTSIAGGLEESADALLRTARLIYDHALGEWFAA